MRARPAIATPSSDPPSIPRPLATPTPELRYGDGPRDERRAGGPRTQGRSGAGKIRPQLGTRAAHQTMSHERRALTGHPIQTEPERERGATGGL